MKKSIGPIKLTLKDLELESPLKIHIVIAEDEDGFVAYPIEIPGVVSDGDSFEEVCKNIKDAIRFHIDTFGSQVLQDLPRKTVLYTADLDVAVSA